MPHPRNLRFFLAGVLAVATVLVAAPGMTRPAEAISNCSVANSSFDSEEQAMLKLINDYRAANGAQPLTISANLNRAAEWMAVDSGKRSYLSHTDTLGRGPQARIADCGGAPWFGENLAAGTVVSTAQKAFSLWRGSSGHNTNMLRPEYQQIGIARHYAPGSRYTWYWVTTFSVTHDGTSLTSTGGEMTGLSSPVPGSKLTSTTATFEWTDLGADEYWLTVGTTFAGYDVYSGSLGTTQQVTVSNLPTQGATVYVRLWHRQGTLWYYTDYTYTGAY